jgi:hypothetical protein
VSIRDEKSNTFHRHFVDAKTEAAIPPGPELAMEESDAWWVCQNQEPLVPLLETHDARFSKLQGILKKYGARFKSRSSLKRSVDNLAIVHARHFIAFGPIQERDKWRVPL